MSFRISVNFLQQQREMEDVRNAEGSKQISRFFTGSLLYEHADDYQHQTHGP